MVTDGKDLGFCVKMVNGTHLHRAGGYAEGGVLDPYEKYLRKILKLHLLIPFIVSTIYDITLFFSKK